METFVLLVVFFGFMAFVFYSIFSKKGRGKMMGGEVEWSGKEYIISEKSKFSGHSEKFQVHAIKTKQLQNNKVGLELRSSSYMHVSAIPISLTIEQALEIAEEIKNAANRNYT